MKKLVLTVTLVVLLAAAVFGGQAIASNKPADVTVSEETSAIWGSSYWGSPLRMKTFDGCFDAQDYPDGYSGYLLKESYPGIRHVSVTISAYNFNDGPNDSATVSYQNCAGTGFGIDTDIEWVLPTQTFETFEFNVQNWTIHLQTPKDSTAKYSYAVTVTYPSNQW